MLISVDYRLLPQVNGIDILADVKAAWRFIFEDLSASHPEFSLEKEKVIVGGQSAGKPRTVVASFQSDGRAPDGNLELTHP
jgi:acetyl esterase/lipase